MLSVRDGSGRVRTRMQDMNEESNRLRELAQCGGGGEDELGKELW